MHPRRRSTGDGFRSNSVASGRSSPDSSIRGHRMYNSEFRNFNRGFGWPSMKSYLPPPLPPPPPRRGDIFMEAGKLAAEYLVSQGLLPPNSLPGKWQNGNLKGSQVGNVQESRVQAREYDTVAPEGRKSGFPRVGNVPDGGSARRRFSDEYSAMGHRNHMRGRKRMGSFRGFGLDLGRENGRKGPWLEKTRVFPDVEDGDDVLDMSYQGEKHVGSGVRGRTPKIITDELPSKSEVAVELGTKLEAAKLPDDASLKASSSCTNKDLPSEKEADLTKGLDDANVLKLETKEGNNGTLGDKMEENALEDLGNKHCLMEDEPISKHGGDLLRLCRFTKVPTKPRSSLTSRVLRVDQGQITEERSAYDITPASGLQVPIEGDSGETSTHSSKGLTFDVSIGPSSRSLDEAVDMGVTFAAERERCTKSQSLSDESSFSHEEESSDGPPGFEKSESMVLPLEVDSFASSDGPPGFERSESMVLSNKDVSFAHHFATWEEKMQPRESPSSGVSQEDDDHLLQNSRAKQSCLEVEKLSPDEKMVESADEKMLMEDGLAPKFGAESNAEAREEKQLSPCSFKNFDLNLMDASEIAEGADGLIQDQVSNAHSALDVEKEAPKDIDLSINNNLSDFDDYHGLMSDGKEAMVVDAANGSLMEDKAFDTPVQKTETMFSISSLENFLNHTENTDHLPDAQDGYGNDISQFLGTDISNCSAVPADIDELQTQMSLHGQEGMIADDDPIYLSLGEIPLSFLGLGVWDQPAQDYGRPF
ncbi:hypothetical protein MRB53_028835 [Persea americana]|uniref:Uncharacterized protein n=1 Tax=Persea americana TaxID=3435 RepID=A0ACC2KGQ7_PERAE|nr:hypothetical protein MRB53_028835 [Persea americana]|eukprot:TRINITY_DN9476_c0_g1_i1.p1 TRINITY_DN9476_c0_g1~~TRINITY_DN9476_c0_g1_i1.p1  ORF type:complete len:761 (+),score=223.55 TRINITY_DN9476_c0_g1_i1:1066-3348(+)